MTQEPPKTGKDGEAPRATDPAAAENAAKDTAPSAEDTAEQRDKKAKGKATVFTDYASI